MKFQRRLNRYLLGVALGLLLIAVIFRGREWGSWLPNPQVLKMTKEFYVEPEEKVWCLMECHGVTMQDIQALMEDGNVDFGDSQTKGKEKEYIIRHETEEGVEFTTHWSIVELSIDKKRAQLIDVYVYKGKDCDC